jgi:hypothetical protein
MKPGDMRPVAYASGRIQLVVVGFGTNNQRKTFTNLAVVAFPSLRHSC